MIRSADAADLPRVRELMMSVDSFWHESWRLDVLERALASAGEFALVHEESGRIDGFACAHDVGFRGYLSELVVSPQAQGRGVGSLLLAEVERRLADAGCSVLIADVWTDAEDFYRARGWTAPSVVLLRKRLGGSATPPSDPPEQSTL
jgi:ribosomal protein S18 acetylase RimI-like enzyme